MEEKDENVVEETTQDNVTKVEIKEQNQDNNVIKVNLDKPPKKKKMPLRSKAQMRYLFATDPKLAKKFVKKTKKSLKSLPNKVKRKKKK